MDPSSSRIVLQISEKEENVKRREHRAAHLSRARKVTIPATLPFQAIRMRLGTSLTAQCVGTIPRGGTLSYIEEIENEDGKWLRLTDESAVLYGYAIVSGQVWCLAYHQHLRRELIPLSCDIVDRPLVRRHEDPPTLHTSPNHHSVIINANETYVLNTSQRIQLYSRPSPDATINGAWLEGRSELEGNGWVSNQHGVWVRVADTNQFILAENSGGNSSILSQSLSVNGNEEDERSPKARKQSSAMSTALRPSVVECCRAVFAAFLWHEHLVKDAMAAAAYLKFHQHLHKLWSHSDVHEAAAPAALQPIIRLWIEVCTAVKGSVDQHLIVPPAGGRAFGYLLCPACRAQYLKRTPAGYRQERARLWREFRLSTNACDLRPEIIMRQNALFLLDLNSSLDCDSKIDSAFFARSSFLSQSLIRTGHASDPGPKALPTSPPAVPMQSFAMDGTKSDEGDTREGCFSVSDIILQYLEALSSYNLYSDVISTKFVRILPHPWRLCYLAGPLAAKMVQHFHAFLYTIAVILQSSGVDTRLRSLCFKAWTIQLTAHEQELLILTCNILGTVGGVLSEPSVSENWVTDSADRSHVQQQLNGSVDVKVREVRDVTCHARVEASSRQAMVVCLTDGSPETFWESGEEDKNRSRTLTVTFDGCSPVLLCLYIDNLRDEACRTSQIAFRAAMSDGSRHDLMSKNVDQNFSGWVKCCIANVTHISVSLKGPHNASRVRQLQMLGFLPEGNADVIRPSVSHQLLFNNTQHDAFALFQAISAQAFSGDSCEQQDALRERVVDLLFSRVTLQPLQNYVCAQVETALESQGKRNYSYAVGLLAMANRMCESRWSGNNGCDMVVRHKVLHAASRLLVFAPETVQTQCLSSLYSLLPTARASTVDVSRLLRHLLIPVAKALVLQVRDKAAHSVMTATMNSCLTNAPLSWRTDRSVSPEIGKLTAQFISDICSGAFNSEWSICFRRELATALLGVIQLTTSLSTSALQQCSVLRFWLSLAALALVRDRSWLALSEKWNDMQTPGQEPITLCENHDDGSTPAQVLQLLCLFTLCNVFCSDCECALCRECFSVMHLHKRNRSHHVASLPPPPARLEEIDIHQGCARMRIANLLILFHGESLNGLVELPSDPFAGITTTARTAQDGNDVCVICFTDRLCAAPCIRLECCHLLHYHCVRAVLEKRWPGPRIQFRFMNCPLCNIQMSHPGLMDLLEPLLLLKADVASKANMRLKFDGLLNCTALTDQQSEFFNRPEEYAMDRYMYVLCNICQKAYFGGESRCQMVRFHVLLRCCCKMISKRQVGDAVVSFSVLSVSVFCCFVKKYTFKGCLIPSALVESFSLLTEQSRLLKKKHGLAIFPFSHTKVDLGESSS
uniref:RCR-type E3 ubiquitin transferase n=1 Tax=Angiostrongylus cantonensis TaxID=6313 RepID=A0A158P743_ANGCA